MVSRQQAMEQLQALDGHAREVVRRWLAAEQALANTRLLECEGQPHEVGRLHGEARVVRALSHVFESALIERS